MDAKEKRQTVSRRFRDPSQLGPVHPAEFDRVLKQAERVARGEPAPDSAAEAGGGTSRDDPIERDRPAYRVAVWLAGRYRDDPETGYNIACRMVALAKVLDAPEMREWVRRQGETTYLVPPAIVAAGAVCRLTAEGTFDPAAFAGEVKRIAEGRRPGVPPPPWGQ